MRVSAWVVSVLCLASVPALAFDIETSVTPNCHETITERALEQSGWPQAVLSLDHPVDPGLANELPFHVDADWLSNDSLGVALLMGARSNDIKSFGAWDLTNLASVHENPLTQDEHCLRSASQDYQAGDLEALADCRAFIHAQVATAVGDGSDAALQTLESQKVGLSYEIDSLQLSRYAFHLGSALHAMEDAFAHQYRSDDLVHVRNVLNYIDPADSKDYSVPRDGYPHRSDLDLCAAAPDLRRADTAAQAAAALARAAGGGGDVTANIDAVLDQWLTYDPACNAASSPCTPVAMGCSSVPGSVSFLGLAAVGAFLMRRRRLGPGAAALCTAALLAALPARAESPDTVPVEQNDAAVLDRRAEPGSAEPGAATPDATSAGRSAGIHDLPGVADPADGSDDAAALAKRTGVYDEAAAARERAEHRWLIIAAGGFSVDQGGMHVGIGGARQFTDAFRLGLRAEYNPWFDLGTGRINPGAANVFATGTWSWWRSRGWTLSSSFSLGMSVLLFDLVGGPKGSVGIYIGLCPIAVTIPIARRMGLMLGTEVGVTAPDLRGIPIVWRQYRFTAAWEYAF